MKCTLIFSLIFENSKNQSFLLRSSRNETNLYTNTTLAYRSTFLERAKESYGMKFRSILKELLPSPVFSFFFALLIFFLKTLVKNSSHLLFSPKLALNSSNKFFCFSSSFSISCFFISTFRLHSAT